MENRKNQGQAQSNSLPKHHQLLIIFLLAVILLAVAGHFILRPDRNAVLRIIYTSDLQGQIAYSQGNYAGYEKVAALAKQSSADGSNVLLLDTGNSLGGSETAEIDDGHSIIKLMNAVGYDAMVPGPMDFIYGSETLSSLRSEAGFPFLAANIKKADGSNAFENYKILNINGVRIGVIGVTTGLNQIRASRSSLTVEDPVKSVEDVIAQLNGKTDAVIVLAYTGDRTVTKSLADIAGVSMVLESGCAEALSTTTDKGTVIASAGRKGSVIGMATLEINRDGASVKNEFYKASMYGNLASDKKLLQTLESVVQDKTSLEAVQVGHVSLQPDTPETDIPEDSETEAALETLDSSETDETEVIDNRIFHATETAIGNLTADAMLAAASGDGAVIAWIRDQSIEGTLLNGGISRGQVDDLFNDNMYLVSCRMTGGEIRSVLEDSFDGYPKAEGFLQVAGLSYTYDISTDIGSHLSEVMAGGHTLDDARTYVVAMTNIMADELGYTSEASGRINNYRTMASVLSDYIEQPALEKPVPESGESGSDGAAGDKTGAETETIQRIHIIE